MSNMNFDARLAGIVRDFEKRAERLFRNSEEGSQRAATDKWNVKLEWGSDDGPHVWVSGRAETFGEAARLIATLALLQPFLKGEEQSLATQSQEAPATAQEAAGE